VGRTALVTGASSGIGRTFCGILASRGWDLIIVARRVDELRAVATDAAYHGVHAEVHAADLSAPEDITALETLIEAREIDLFVNNAGVGSFGPFTTSAGEHNDAIIAVNVRAYARVLRLVARSMVGRGRGGILNVASVAGFQPGPLMSVYYASKAYELSLSEAVAEEVASAGVTVTALCPGPTRSPFHERAGMRIGNAAARAMPEAREVAEFGLRALERGRRVAVFGTGFRLMIFAQRLLPRALVTRAVGAMQRRRT